MNCNFTLRKTTAAVFFLLFSGFVQNSSSFDFAVVLFDFLLKFDSVGLHIGVDSTVQYKNRTKYCLN